VEIEYHVHSFNCFQQRYKLSFSKVKPRDYFNSWITFCKWKGWIFLPVHKF